MEIILLDKVENLGNLGDKVNVKPGYARNFLIPHGKAQPATAANMAKFETRRAELEQASRDAMTRAEGRRDQLEGLEITIGANAGGEGKLFGSVGPADVADAIAAKGIELEKREIRMPEGPVRQAGEHEVQVHLHTDVDATVKLIVVAEE